jgi:hypothetical protein
MVRVGGPDLGARDVMRLLGPFALCLEETDRGMGNGPCRRHTGLPGRLPPWQGPRRLRY